MRAIIDEESTTDDDNTVKLRVSYGYVLLA